MRLRALRIGSWALVLGVILGAAPNIALGALVMNRDLHASEHEPTGYLLNLYHFNLQYVAGSEKAMRHIVERSFEPLVEFYLAHPEWGADFEMQGLFIEFLAEHYPAVLDKFTRLVIDGQAELVSFHYSDQLLLAFPARDQERSLAINERVFARHGLTRSGVVFAQEAQFGEGMCALATEHGYAVAVLTRDQYVWFQDDDRFPYYAIRGMDVVLQRDVTDDASPIRVRWNFLDDGELVVTGGISPYFAGLFKTRTSRLEKLERRLQRAEADGYHIATITEYHHALQRAGVKPAPLKPVLDSPWRPKDASGVFQWMGKYVAPWEDDYGIRTENWRVRDALITAEEQGHDPTAVQKAWRHLLNAEVSDATGWFPLPVEVRYAREEHAAALDALGLVEAPRLDGRELLGLSWQPAPEPPVALRLTGRMSDARVSWARAVERENIWSVEASFTTSWLFPGTSAVEFPLAEPVVAYSPAGLETEVRTIAFSEMKLFRLHLALPNGLIGLGDDWWLIRENRHGVLAMAVDSHERTGHTVRFEIKGAWGKDIRLRFFLYHGAAEDAVALANTINRI